MVTQNPTITVKQGDDFSLDLTVKDTNNDIAIAAKVLLDAAQVVYDEALAADPQVPTDISDALAALGVAQTAYDNAIIVDISTWIINSHMAWCGKLITQFTVVITDGPTGKFAINAAKEVTQLWKPRLYEADIEFNSGLFGRQSSQNLYIQVVRGITHVE